MRCCQEARAPCVPASLGRRSTPSTSRHSTRSNNRFHIYIEYLVAVAEARSGWLSRSLLPSFLAALLPPSPPLPFLPLHTFLSSLAPALPPPPPSSLSPVHPLSQGQRIVSTYCLGRGEGIELGSSSSSSIIEVKVARSSSYFTERGVILSFKRKNILCSL